MDVQRPSSCAFAPPAPLLAARFARSSALPSPRRARAPARHAARMCASDTGAKSDANAPSATAGAAAGGAATEEPPVQEMEVMLDENIAEFCSINPKTGKPVEMTVHEKEALFLDAVQAFFRGTASLSDAEFDALKDELTWQGSEVVSLSRDEIRFLDAARAYERGEPSMPDDEFDALKTKLYRAGSSVAIQRGPRCSIQRKITFSDVIPDRRRTFVLYVPAGLVSALVWLSVAFELTPLHRVDPVISLLIGTPFIYIAARLLTSIVVPDPQIVVGDCPSCGRRTHVLFGNVLNVKGWSDAADVKCDKCKAQLKVEKETNRMILIAEGKK